MRPQATATDSAQPNPSPPASVAIRAKGSGLGLFIVRSVAKKHGGRAFAESQGQGHGSTFTLLLPKATEA